MSVYILATLDTKAPEAEFLKQQLRSRGVDVMLVDTGCQGIPGVSPDVDRERLFDAAGVKRAELIAKGDRGEAVNAAARGAAAVVRAAHAAGQLSGVLGIGGSAGTTIATAAMRQLPLGLPKVMVSTLASGDVNGFVGHRDIVMINSVVDFAGINRISRIILSEAAAAIAGMLQPGAPQEGAEDRPLVAATMFGVTTPCVQQARTILEQSGYEVLVFHATGSGGRAMEALIADGLIAGVLDMTTTELADELVGGVMSAGPERLLAAGRRGIPQVVSVGAADMVNFWARPTVPPEFADRLLYQHNAQVTLMRTTVEECREIGRRIAQRLSAARGPVRVLLPERGVSALDEQGKAFDDPEARRALFESIRAGLPADRVQSLDQHINDVEFARAAALALVEMMQPTSPVRN